MALRKKKSHKLSPLSLACTLMLWSASAYAGFCSISSSGLVFGAYQPLFFAGKLQSSNSTSSATLSVTCTGVTGNYSMAIGPGNLGNGDGISNRYMSNSSGDPMAFNIYTDPTYMTVWGNGNIGALVVRPVPSNNVTDAVTAYGRIPGGQHTLRAGSYSASMAVTITYHP